MDTSSLPAFVEVLDQDETNNRVYCKVPLEKVLVSDDAIKKIREKDAYSAKALAELRTSLNKDGKMRMVNPVHTHVSADGQSLVVVGGNRRITAASALMKEGTFPKDTPTRCYLYMTNDRLAILTIATNDNSHRINLGDIEQYNQVKLLSGEGMGKQLIAQNMGIEIRKVERMLAIGEYPEFVEMLKEGMGYSSLARLAEKLVKCKDEVQKGALEFFRNWMDKMPERIKVKEKKASLKNKTLGDEDKKWGKLLEKGEFAAWEEQLGAGKVPDGKNKVRTVNLSDDNGKIKIDSAIIDDTWTEEQLDGAKVAYEVAIEAIDEKMAEARRRAKKGGKTNWGDILLEKRGKSETASDDGESDESDDSKPDQFDKEDGADEDEMESDA